MGASALALVRGWVSWPMYWPATNTSIDDDTVYTAQTLQTGEAFRLPNVPGLVVDVSVPSSMEVFVAGQYIGQLTQPLTKASVLAPNP